MPSKSFCFATLKKGKRHYYDFDYNELHGSILNGLHAFVYYPDPGLIVFNRLINYGSQHSGLNALVQIKKQSLDNFRNHFFPSGPTNFILPNIAPAAGGVALFWKGLVVIWHLKSGTYSFKNPACHDNNSELKTLIEALGLPPENFITIAQAEFFEQYCLRSMFEPDGQYRDLIKAPELIHKICKVMELQPPKYEILQDDIDTPFESMDIST